MNTLLECINDIAKSKGMSTEEYINECQENGYNKLKKLFPLGIDGKSVLGLPSVSKGEDTYVPGLEVMTGHNYKDALMKSKSSEDGKIKERYNVPDAPIGWWVSEKFDGQRAVWDGEKFVSRGATGDPRVYPYIPRWFKALMPPGIALDGELYIKREYFSETTSILRKKLKKVRTKKDISQEELDKQWSQIKFMIFDVINDQLYEDRKVLLEKIVKERCQVWEKLSVPVYMKKGDCPLIITPQIKIKSEQELMNIYNALVDKGAEGIMIRAPGIPYIPRRTKFMLKMKLEDDDECIVVGYKPGEGKYTSLLGSFLCRNKNGKEFYVGGMNDTIRKDYLTTHPIGTQIVYQFNGLTADGIPRHPRYKGIRND